MNLHEYQAKDLFREYGIPTLPGAIGVSVTDARAAAARLGGEIGWVVKAQVHAGGRGKAGGVKRANTLDEVAARADAMLGKPLVTKQTDARGLPVNVVLIEPQCKIKQEFYLSAVIDRSKQRVTLMGSAAGGMDIEEVAATSPEKLIKVDVNPALGVLPFQARLLGFGMGMTLDQVNKLWPIVSGLYRLFVERDASLVEINPLILTESDELLALDAKINLDDNALYRQHALAALRDVSQEDARELEAQAHSLNYVSLDGTIGCMVNGAGLAMATMDLIKLHGGVPANFLDVGGGTTKERVAAAFKLILSDPKVKAVLVNIFGGIVRCDLIAEGLIDAVREVHVDIPVIVRLEGTNAEIGRGMLAASGLALTTAESLTEAAQKAVRAAQGG